MFPGGAVHSGRILYSLTAVYGLFRALLATDGAFDAVAPRTLSVTLWASVGVASLTVMAWPKVLMVRVIAGGVVIFCLMWWSYLALRLSDSPTGTATASSFALLSVYVGFSWGRQSFRRVVPHDGN